MRAEPGGPRAENALRSRGGDTHQGTEGGDKRPHATERGTPLSCKGTPSPEQGTPSPSSRCYERSAGFRNTAQNLPEKTPLWRIFGMRRVLFALFFHSLFFVVVVIFAVAPAALLPRPCTAPPLRGGSAICGPRCAALRSRNAGPRSCPA